MADNPNKTCIKCSEPATMSCLACVEGVDVNGNKLPPPTCCGQACQSAHFNNSHKDACKAANDRRQLYRAGELVQTLFYEYRRAAFDVPIRSVGQDATGKTCIFQEYGEADTILVEFPDNLFSTEEDKKAMLGWNSCEDGLVRMRGIIAQCFEGLDKDKMEDIKFKLKPGVERFGLYKADGQEVVDGDVQKPDEHFVHRVEIAGTQFAFDLSSAQYSHFRTVTPWTEYAAKLVERVVRTRPFGVTVHGLVQEANGPTMFMWGLTTGNFHTRKLLLMQKHYMLLITQARNMVIISLLRPGYCMRENSSAISTASMDPNTWQIS